jgi:hypothetical protein
MRLLDVLRTKSPTDRPHSAVLEQALADVDGRLDQNTAAARALTDELPAAVIRSIDAGATERKKLANLTSEREALVTTAAALRRELDEALARERQAALQVRWDESQKLGDAFVAAASRADAAISAAAATLATAIRELNAAESAFEGSLPDRPARPWGYASQRAVARDGLSVAADAIRAHVRNDRSIEKVPALKALAQEQLDGRFCNRPSTAEQITRALSADEPSEINQAAD